MPRKQSLVSLMVSSKQFLHLYFFDIQKVLKVSSFKKPCSEIRFLATTSKLFLLNVVRWEVDHNTSIFLEYLQYRGCLKIDSSCSAISISFYKSNFHIWFWSDRGSVTKNVDHLCTLKNEKSRSFSR